MTHSNTAIKRPARLTKLLSQPVTFRMVATLVVLFAVVAAIAYLIVKNPRHTAFVELRHIDEEVANRAIERIAEEWQHESAAMALEVAPFTMHYGGRERLYDVLRQKTGQSIPNYQKNEWYLWLWSQPAPDPAVLNRMRHEFYSKNVYPLGTLAGHFKDNPKITVRADEIRWGGILRDGPPTIFRPQMIRAAEATYLADTDRIFGVSVNGDARAYPRRVMGHHEIVIDKVGGEHITSVYCPLCEAMIAYHSHTSDGTSHEFGTSAFVYRSNKLLYDRDSLSLWSTLKGEPVLGRLVGAGMSLRRSPVVTTSWGEWRKTHPGTLVLSLRGLPRVLPTGAFDYTEGAAYREYYETDKLMFAVPTRDQRLKNKDEVFVIRVNSDRTPTAISTEFLRAHPVHQLLMGEDQVLVVTTPGGANRAFAAAGRRFRSELVEGRVIDDSGGAWAIHEDALKSGSVTLARLPAHRAFWFAWHAAFPNTLLIK